MADKTDRVTIIADNVAHVKPLLPGQTKDDVIQKFWEGRARQKLEREIQQKPHAVAAPEILAAVTERERAPDPAKELAEFSGPGPCPYCGEVKKRRDTHIRFCPQRPTVD